MTRGVIPGSGSRAGMTRGVQGVISGTARGASRGTGVPIRGTAHQVIHGRRVPTRGTTRETAPGHSQVAGRCRPTRAVTRAAPRGAIPGRAGRISTATSGLARHLAPGIRGLCATRAGTRVLARARCPRGLAGGRVTAGSLIGEQYLLDLEREAFLSLCGERKTQERIAFTLKTGKPLRN